MTRSAEHSLDTVPDLVRLAARHRGGVEVPDYDVTDPVGRDASVHADVVSLLDRECATIAAALAAVVTPGRPPA